MQRCVKAQSLVREASRTSDSPPKWGIPLRDGFCVDKGRACAIYLSGIPLAPLMRGSCNCTGPLVEQRRGCHECMHGTWGMSDSGAVLF